MATVTVIQQFNFQACMLKDKTTLQIIGVCLSEPLHKTIFHKKFPPRTVQCIVYPEGRKGHRKLAEEGTREGEEWRKIKLTAGLMHSWTEITLL